MAQTAFSSDGLTYATANIPENWSARATKQNGRFGYGYPFGYILEAASQDKSNVIRVYCNARYEEDSTYPYPQNTLKTTPYGKLLLPFTNCERFIDERAKQYLKDAQNVKLVRTDSYFDDKVDYNKQSRKLFEDGIKKYSSSRDVTYDGAYDNAMIRVYSYEYKNYKRMVAISARITAETMSEYIITKIPQELLFDAFSASYVKGMYDRINANGEGIKNYRTVTYWIAKQRYMLDATCENFEELYKGAFKEFQRSYKEDKGLSSEYKRQQDIIDSENAKKRAIQEKKDAEKRRAEEERYERERQQRERERQAAADIRETQRQTSAIISSSYNNTSRAHDTANKRWSESYRNSYTYVDRFGSEYLADGNGRYAFTNGTRVVTTDDPLGPGYGWEEVKKKY